MNHGDEFKKYIDDMMQDYSRAMQQQVNRSFNFWKQMFYQKYEKIPAKRREEIAIAIRMAGVKAAVKAGYNIEEVDAVYLCHPALKDKECK